MMYGAGKNRFLNGTKTILSSIAVSISVITGPARAVSYYDIHLPSYPPTGQLYDAGGINDSNQITGPSWTQPHGDVYVWQNGVITELSIPGSPFENYAHDINNAGCIVGGESSMTPGWLLEGGEATSLGTLGGAGSIPFAVNENNQVVGSAQTAVSNQIAPFFWENGSMQNLGTLGGTYGRAYDINNQGMAVGFSKNAEGHSRAFACFQGQAMMDLGTLGGTQSVAAAVNDANEVVGWAEVQNGYQHAFVWNAGVMTDLGTLGGNQSQAFGINNAGQIVGWAETETGYRPLVLWENKIAVRLDQLVAPDSGWELLYPGESQINVKPPFSINNHGSILGKGFINTLQCVFLMTARSEDFLRHDSDRNGVVNLSDLARLSSEWIQ